MKNMMKPALIAIVALFAASGLSVLESCKKLAGSNVQFRLTDAPGDYDSVIVEVKAISILYADADSANGWVQLNTKAGFYDLLQLQNDISVAIADKKDLRPGKINQVRFELGETNYVVVGGIRFDLKVPSGMQTGIKINLNTTLEAGRDYVITLDFDAKASIVTPGLENTYLLKPVIKVKAIAEK